MDWITEGTTALISGMSAVFLILILISLMISALGNVGKLEKKAVQEVPVQAQRNPAPQTPQVDQSEEQRKVVAAITVALSQELGLTLDQFVVRKFRRL